MPNSFSILLPVYNGMAYLKDCLESLLNQQYDNYNIIVLDSGCTDGSIEFIESYKSKKIIIYRTEKRLYIEENWGRIKDIDKNEFMTIIGQDDILYPNYLQVINDLIDEHPNASLYHTHFNYIDNKSKIIRSCKQMPQIIDASKFIEMFLTIQMDSMGTGYLMRSKDYDKIGGIPIHYPALLFADFELWLNLTEIKYQAVSCQNCFAFRIHQSTTTTSGNTKFLIAFETFIYYLKSKTNNKALKNSIEKNVLKYIQFYCQGLTHRLLKTPSSKREKDETVKKILIKCKEYANLLVPNNTFNPAQKWSVKLALLIDSNFLTRKLFLLMKTIYKKPILE